MTKLRVLDLFSGVGAFSLGLERTGGFQTVAFCERGEEQRRVLRSHWSEVPIYDDVCSLTAERLRSDGVASPDVICGGFPCQDISQAGTGEGIDGERSGLWREYARLVRELRPSYVLVENVAALLVRGIDRVLGDLAVIGYDAEWHRIPAAAVGLPHRRDRIWIAANRHGVRELQPGWGIGHERRWRGNRREAVDWVLSRGGVLRSHDGIAAGLDRIGMCGNALVPDIPEAIGRAILAAA